MEAPTQKEVLRKLEWRPLDADQVGSGHNLEATYEWEDHTWTAEIHVFPDERYFNGYLNRRGPNQFKLQRNNIEEVVIGCVDAILERIEDHVRKYKHEQEKERKLSEYNQKTQEWADRANSVSIKD